VEDIYHYFETQSVIYIARNKQEMIFKDNLFENNIGLFGGAITIESPDFTEDPTYSPMVVVNNN
jgi:predicted sulfurtransferase